MTRLADRYDQVLWWVSRRFEAPIKVLVVLVAVAFVLVGIMLALSGLVGVF